MSLGEKPRQQLAVQQASEQPSVGRISEESSVGSHPPPVPTPQKGSRRTSLSFFSRQKSLQRGDAADTNGRLAQFAFESCWEGRPECQLVCLWNRDRRLSVGSFLPLYQCGRAHDCQAKGGRFKS